MGRVGVVEEEVAPLGGTSQHLDQASNIDIGALELPHDGRGDRRQLISS